MPGRPPYLAFRRLAWRPRPEHQSGCGAAANDVRKQPQPCEEDVMIGDLFDSPWKIAIFAVVLIVLFGSRKLPEAARSLGRSMRILKAEVTSLHDDGNSAE